MNGIHEVVGSIPSGSTKFFNDLEELFDRRICASKHIVSALGEFHAKPQRCSGRFVMENKTFKIDEIYVPVNRRKTLNMKVVNEIAESMLEKGQLTPILVRRDRERFVLVEGLHRLEACKALGEGTVVGLVVHARLH